MSVENCFCHLNGYEVKDAKAREEIETLQTQVQDSGALYYHYISVRSYDEDDNGDPVYTSYKYVYFCISCRRAEAFTDTADLGSYFRNLHNEQNVSIATVPVEFGYYRPNNNKTSYNLPLIYIQCTTNGITPYYYASVGTETDTDHPIYFNYSSTGSQRFNSQYYTIDLTDTVVKR